MKKKFTNTIIYVLLITYLLYDFVAGIVGDFFINLFGNTNSITINIIKDYFIYQIITIILFMLIMLFKNNRYMFKKFTLHNNKIINGLLIGFFMNAFCILVAYIKGSITLSFNYLDIPLILFAFIGIVIQSASEEIACRIFLYEKVLKIYNKPILAIIINSLFFSLTHINNEGITLIAFVSIFGMGIVTSLYYYYNKNIWGSIAIHTAWNFTQNFLFGLPNSGISSTYSLFKLVDSTNSFAYNTIFGIESTYVAIVVMIFTSLLLYLYNSKYCNIKIVRKECTNG